MITRTESIKQYLSTVTHSDLAALYCEAMECQVIVGQDGGTRVDGEFKGRAWHAYTDGLQTWKPFRIPYNAASSTECNYDLTIRMGYDLAAHAEGIGMTGWDWQRKESKWVAFDFDAITGHKENHERILSESELSTISSVVTSVSWVTVRKSTGGKGLHIYVFLEPVQTNNHTEHAALARAILGRLSGVCGYDFESKVDKCGGNMWVWHRKMAGTDGLRLLKSGTTLEDPPLNWRDHITVVSGRNRKTRPKPISGSESVGESPSDSLVKSDSERLFDELTSQRPRIQLDEEHRRLIKYLLEDNKTASWWDQDHWMLVAHTYRLARAHEDLGLRGIFKTLADHDENGTDHNCFLFPMRRGGWAVRRYSPGAAEHESWTQDSSGYTRTYLNVDPDLKIAARAYGAEESTTGAFNFRELEVAVNAAKLLGARINIEPWASTRPAALFSHKKDGRLVVEFERRETDILTGWSPEKTKWRKIFDVRTSSSSITDAANDIGNYDDLIRHLVTTTNEDHGWVVKTDKGWQVESRENVKSYLKGNGLSAKEVEILMGQAVSQAWQIVNEPFKDEYPGDRKWNRDSAQFRYLPNPNRDDLNHPNWLKVLNHCGEGLNEAIEANRWCQANSILTGADYLKAWIASIFQKPLEPLPYLFFYSCEQDTGKSIFHEAIELLITKGYQRADAALINPSGFNGELKGAIICVVEETDLSTRRNDAYNRIKDWVTARQLPIHPKGGTPYHIPNSTHWVQTSNNINACPVFQGDTRITMIRVLPLLPNDLIPKPILLGLLEKEAPDFIASILDIELPPPTGRLALPVITTEEKLETQLINRTPIESFLDEKCYSIDGQWIKFSDLFDRFQEYIPPEEVCRWTKVKFGQQVGIRYLKGRNPTDMQMYFGNISLDPNAIAQPKFIIEIRGDYRYLVPVSNPNSTVVFDPTNGEVK